MWYTYNETRTTPVALVHQNLALSGTIIIYQRIVARLLYNADMAKNRTPEYFTISSTATHVRPLYSQVHVAMLNRRSLYIIIQETWCSLL